MHQSKRPLVQGTDAENRAIFTALFRVLYPDLLAYTIRFTKHRSTAEDLVQEAFVRLWERCAGLDRDRSLKAFLYKTVRNSALNEQRNQQNRTRLNEYVDQPAQPPQPGSELDADLLGRKMRIWIDAMPARRREAFELSRFCGLSHREIAQVMDLSVQTVQKHITQALLYLREKLQTHQIESS